jgi:hypothetical protein
MALKAGEEDLKPLLMTRAARFMRWAKRRRIRPPMGLRSHGCSPAVAGSYGGDVVLESPLDGGGGMVVTGLLGGGCRSCFMTLPPMALQEQSAMVLLLERVLVSWSLAIDEHSGLKDLCGSGRQSVIPYVHERTELYYSSLPSLSLPFCPLALTDLFFRPL